MSLNKKKYSLIGYKGKQVRDNLHSADLVNCFWEFYKKPRRGEVYNMGGGRFSNCSIIEALDLVESLANIKINKQKYESLFSLLNSDIFKSIDFKSLEMVTTSTKDFDKKINTVMINAEINDFRPEALLEAENIDVTLKSSDFIKNSTVEKKRYSRGRLPVKITFMI